MSGQECEFAEVGSDDGEVSSVERGDLGGSQTLGGTDHGCVDRAEGQVLISADELGDAHPVGRSDRLGDEVSGRQVAEESDLGVAAEAAGEEIRDFGDDEGRDDERARVCLEQFEALGVVAVVAVDVGVQRAGVDDQCDCATSPAMISSIRSEMSWRPLAPAPAARSRRWPRGASSKVSIASRVSSETVTPRRCASWRNRASSSSGSFTVVRCMYASIPQRMAGTSVDVLTRRACVGRSPGGRRR